MKHMKDKKKRLGLFRRARNVSSAYEREKRLAKVKECMELKDENEKLWDMAVKQRIALDALQRGHAADMAEMTEALRIAHEKLAAAEAEKNRYREALKRAFPKGATTA